MADDAADAAQQAGLAKKAPRNFDPETRHMAGELQARCAFVRDCHMLSMVEALGKVYGLDYLHANNCMAYTRQQCTAPVVFVTGLGLALCPWPGHAWLEYIQLPRRYMYS